MASPPTQPNLPRDKIILVVSALISPRSVMLPLAAKFPLNTRAVWIKCTPRVMVKYIPATPTRHTDKVNKCNRPPLPPLPPLNPLSNLWFHFGLVI